MAEVESSLTHTAYALKRESRTAFRWLKIGSAKIASDGSGSHQVYIDRLPLGGFTGHIHLSPIGVKPNSPQSQLQIPSRPLAEEDEDI